MTDTEDAAVTKYIPQFTDLPAQKAKLVALVRLFVRRYDGQSSQHTEGWYDAIKVTVGGSELAAVMGWNPYRTFWEVVAEKAGVAAGWDGGSIECHWGTMFEDVMARFIELDCGSEVLGAEICIQAIRGHRNSPDGFAVIGMYRVGGGWQIWTTDCEFPPEVFFIVIIETKCPYRRIPDGKVPRYYQPQVWSGLTVSPICHFGLFVDGVFRRCNLADLGPSGAYDLNYHSADKKPLGLPVAWGLTGVYAPSIDAPLEIRIRGAVDVRSDEDEETFGEFGAPRTRDASAEAWTIHSAYFGVCMDSSAASRADVVDFGDCPKKLFDTAMSLIADKQFKTVHVDPCFFDGRGADLHSGATIGRTIDRLRRKLPAEHYYLLGVIPWKLYGVNYVPVPRRIGFRDELVAAVNSVHNLVTEAKESGDPAAFLQSKIEAESARQSEKAKISGRFTRPSAVDDAALQELFNLI